MKYKVLRNIRVASSTGMKVFKVGETVSEDDFIASADSFVKANYIQAIKQESKEPKAEEAKVEDTKVEETEVKTTKKAKKKRKKKTKKKVDA